MTRRMAILKRRGDGNMQERNHKAAPLHDGDEDRGRKSLFGSYPNLDTVLWVKGLALNPCKAGALRDANKESCDQILNVRKVMLMTNIESPRRKRKLQQFLKSKVAPVSTLTSVKYNQQNSSKLSRGHLSTASSDSCLLNSADSSESFNRQLVQNWRCSGRLLTSEDTFGGKQVAANLSFLDDAIDFVAPTFKYSSPLIDSDESVNGSNPLTPENLTRHGPPLLDANDSAHSSYSTTLKEPEQLNLRRVHIPVGPRFQAEVPDWNEPVDKEKHDGVEGEPENLRWLGILVWPLQGASREISLTEIGKGRSDSCSCVSPGFSSCIKDHILEERLHLQSELGLAFLSWKFDEMGEVVSYSWTLKEQKSFSLLRQKQVTDETNFWEQASKSFPSKCKKSLLSYYFNVFTPRRLSLQTKLSLKQVDSDDDEVHDVDHTDSQEKCRARSDGSRKSNDVRRRYLRQVH